MSVLAVSKPSFLQFGPRTKAVINCLLSTDQKCRCTELVALCRKIEQACSYQITRLSLELEKCKIATKRAQEQSIAHKEHYISLQRELDRLKEHIQDIKRKILGNETELNELKDRLQVLENTLKEHQAELELIEQRKLHALMDSFPIVGQIVGIICAIQDDDPKRAIPYYTAVCATASAIENREKYLQEEMAKINEEKEKRETVQQKLKDTLQKLTQEEADLEREIETCKKKASAEDLTVRHSCRFSSSLSDHQATLGNRITHYKQLLNEAECMRIIADSSGTYGDEVLVKDIKVLFNKAGPLFDIARPLFYLGIFCLTFYSTFSLSIF